MRVTLTFDSRVEGTRPRHHIRAVRRRPRPHPDRGIRPLRSRIGAASLTRMVTTLLPHYETTDVRIENVVRGPLESNGFVLLSKSRVDAVIIYAANEHELLLEVSKRTGVRRVLTTHGHADHIQAVTQMRDAGIDVGSAADDAKMLPAYDFVIPDD